MKVAIPSENNSVSTHFGRCPSFVIAEIKGGEVKSREEIQSPGHNPGLLPDYFSNLGVDTVIAGGMGMRARELFDEKKIKVILGIEGNIDKVLDDLKNGRLKEGESICSPGAGKGYGLEKPECDHDKHK